MCKFGPGTDGRGNLMSMDLVVQTKVVKATRDEISVCESPISDRAGVEDTDSDGIDVILPQHTKITDHNEITYDPAFCTTRHVLLLF